MTKTCQPAAFKVSNGAGDTGTTSEASRGAGRASQHERGRTWSGAARPCHLTHARTRATQTFTGALPVGGVDRPYLRSVPAAVPDVRWANAPDRVHYRGRADQEDP